METVRSHQSLASILESVSDGRYAQCADVEESVIKDPRVFTSTLKSLNWFRRVGRGPAVSLTVSDLFLPMFIFFPWDLI